MDVAALLGCALLRDVCLMIHMFAEFTSVLFRIVMIKVLA